MLNSNHKGNVAELAIATEAAKLGLSVLKPLTEHERYDLAIGLAGRLLRVQCKWANYKGNVVRINLAGSRINRSGYVRSTYGADEIDALAAFCGDLDTCYLLPVEMVAGRHAIQLRTVPALNNQTAGVNSAAAYELGAVAQLEERRRGTAEARGSSPLSSISEGPPPLVAVGMDQFYARLAHHVRAVEAGGEVLVTRRGKPVARLVAVDLKD